MGLLDTISDELNQAVIDNGSGSSDPGDYSKVYKVLAKYLGGLVFNILVTVLLFITIAFVFYGGFLYFTAYGDENRASMAKKTITYAIIGFIIAGVAFTIVSFVRNTAEKAGSSGSGTQVDNPLQNTNANQQTNTFDIPIQ